MASYQLNTNTPSVSIFLDSINAQTIMSIDETTGVCSSDITWYVQPTVSCPFGQTMILSLLDCQFANVFPNVVAGINDSLLYSVDDGVNYITKTIPANQYNIDTLVVWLNANTAPYVWSIDYVTYKLTITSATSTIRISGSSTCGGSTRKLQPPHSTMRLAASCQRLRGPTSRMGRTTVL